MTRVSLCGCLRERVLGLLGEALVFVRLSQEHYRARPACEALACSERIWWERRPWGPPEDVAGRD